MNWTTLSMIPRVPSMARDESCERSEREGRERERGTFVTVISSQCSGVTMSSSSSVKQQMFR
jgi:hypothetical protein